MDGPVSSEKADPVPRYRTRRRIDVVGIVAIILAVGVAIALVLLVVAAYLVRSDTDAALGENMTQVLTGLGGGMIGVLGAYVGYSFGRRDREL